MGQDWESALQKKNTVIKVRTRDRLRSPTPFFCRTFSIYKRQSWRWPTPPWRWKGGNFSHFFLFVVTQFWIFYPLNSVVFDSWLLVSPPRWCKKGGKVTLNFGDVCQPNDHNEGCVKKVGTIDIDCSSLQKLCIFQIFLKLNSVIAKINHSAFLPTYQHSYLPFSTLTCHQLKFSS